MGVLVCAITGGLVLRFAFLRIAALPASDLAVECDDVGTCMIAAVFVGR